MVTDETWLGQLSCCAYKWLVSPDIRLSSLPSDSATVTILSGEDSAIQLGEFHKRLCERPSQSAISVSATWMVVDRAGS